jgi:DNA polymerase III delta subunit
VVLVESAADGERKTLAGLAAACDLHAVLDALPPEVLARWAGERLRRLGVVAEAGTVERLLAESRLETAEVINEVDKLADWAGPGGRVSHREAEQVLRPQHSGSLAALAVAVAEGRNDLAVDQLLRALESGESPGTVLFQMQTLFAGALRLRTHQWGWIRDRENSERLARRHSERELTASLDLLYRVERAWKSGRGEVRTLLSRAVIGLAGKAEGPRSR